MKHIVTIGGGSGHAQVLKGLKHISDIRITSICPSTDSGGSTGILEREHHGSGYTGDLTKCILALSPDETLVKALSSRPLDVHSVKNLLFHALERVSDTSEALEVMWRVCGIAPHRAIPVTTEKAELFASLQTGAVLSGEATIDTIAKNPLWHPDTHTIADIYLKPQVSISDQAAEAVHEADYIIICPGDLYSSILPVLLPDGMQKAIQKSSAPIVMILNIMTKTGETDNYTATDFVKRIEGGLGRKASYIVANDAPIPQDILVKYAFERKVELGGLEQYGEVQTVTAPLAKIGEGEQIISDSDVIRETIERILSTG